MAGYRVTGAKIGGDGIRQQIAVGKHEGKLYLVAFNQLRSEAEGGENWLRGFRSTDDGLTWTEVGSSIRTRPQWVASVADPRSDKPYLFVTFMNWANNHTIARFNMALETFDIENPFHVPVGTFGLTAIGINAAGDIRIGISEGAVTEQIDHSFTHEITPYTVAFSATTLSAGGNQPVPGITPGIGSYSLRGVVPAPAAGGHPEGAAGWAYVMQETVWNGSSFDVRTVFFDDTGAGVPFTDQGNDAGRVATRMRNGAPEPILLVHQFGTSNYFTELISNDSAASVQCSQSQIPTITIQGVPLNSGGGTVVGREGDMYLIWFQGATLKASKASGSLASCGGWGAFETLLTFDEAPLFIEGATNCSDGIAITYAVNDVSPSEFDQHFDVWFAFYSIGGGCPQPEVSTHECSDAPEQDTESNCGSGKQGYAI